MTRLGYLEANNLLDLHATDNLQAQYNCTIMFTLRISLYTCVRVCVRVFLSSRQALPFDKVWGKEGLGCGVISSGCC